MCVCEPGILDWLSGIVLPVLVTSLTIGVAVWAGRIAKRSNELAERIHDDTKRDAARRLRLPFKTVLNEFWTAITAARTLGDNDTVKLVMERVQALSIAADLADDPTATKMIQYASTMSREHPLEPRDIDAFMALNRRITAMQALWVDDPEAAIAAMEVDENFQALGGFSK